MVDNLLLEEFILLDFSFHSKDETKLYHGFKIEHDFDIVSKIGEVFNFEFVNIESSSLNGRFLLVSYGLDFDIGEDLFSILVEYSRGLNCVISEENYKNIFLTCKKFKFKNKSLTGLIGELGFIYYRLLQNDYEVVGMWHSDINDVFDFYNSELVYEVKTTKSVVRKHTLKYSQFNKLVRSNSYRTAYLVSVQLFRGTEPHTLKDLIERIQSKLNDDLEVIFLNKLEFYSDLLKNSYKFDIEGLINGIRFYNPSKIPNLEFDSNYIDEDSVQYSIILENLDGEVST